MAGVREYMRRGLRRDVRAVLHCACCTAGGILGLWQGMLAVPTEAPSPHVWTAFTDVMQPVTIGVGIGVVVGALLATGVCVAVPWLRPSGERA
jgi:hypothetical protein